MTRPLYLGAKNDRKQLFTSLFPFIGSSNSQPSTPFFGVPQIGNSPTSLFGSVTTPLFGSKSISSAEEEKLGEQIGFSGFPLFGRTNSSSSTFASIHINSNPFAGLERDKDNKIKEVGSDKEDERPSSPVTYKASDQKSSLDYNKLISVNLL